MINIHENAAPLVSVQKLGKSYDNAGAAPVVILKDIDITLRRGEIVGLLGRSGSGKSTLLRAIAGLLEPTSGSVTFDGAPVAGVNTGVSVVFQTFALFPWLTVQQNVELGLEAKGIAREERNKRAAAAIELIGLSGYENAYPKELSGGMRQRVGLARALVVHPKLLLMDEPFSALDVLTAETLRSDLLDLWYEGRMPLDAILIVTHNIEEAVLMCDRILIFGSNPGRVIGEISVNMPQPRNRLDPTFRAMVDDIYARMTARASVSTGRDGLFPGTGIAMKLPPVSSNEIAGLVETLAGAPYVGRADLPPLAKSLGLESDDFLPVAEVSQLLRFAELEGGDIKLTAAGKRFADAEVEARKSLFAQQLQSYVPLAGHVRRILDERAGHTAPARRFRDELEDFMAEEDAAQTLKVLIGWARYAEYFAFDEEADMFRIDHVE